MRNLNLNEYRALPSNHRCFSERHIYHHVDFSRSVKNGSPRFIRFHVRQRCTQRKSITVQTGTPDPADDTQPRTHAGLTQQSKPIARRLFKDVYIGLVRLGPCVVNQACPRSRCRPTQGLRKPRIDDSMHSLGAPTKHHTHGGLRVAIAIQPATITSVICLISRSRSIRR